MTQTQELESRIRDFINEPWRNALLYKDKAAWGMCCCALDVIGDTELALEAYLHREAPALEPGNRDTGNLYITIYGVLQVLFVQQDAVEHLAEALRCPHERSATLKSIRETRNDAIGHPTKREHRKQGKAFISISRITMFRSGFQMMTQQANGSHEMKQVNLPEMVELQRTEIGAAMLRIATKLKEEEMAHRTQFRDKKLAALFPAWLGHTHEKVSEAIGNGEHEFGAAMLGSVAECVDKFKAELTERGLLDGGMMAHDIAELERPTARLRDYFAGSATELTPEDARVFHFFLQEKLKGLMRLAVEIDAEYAKGVQE
jgi:hypothetical protein